MTLRPCLAALGLTVLGCAASTTASLTPAPAEVAIIDLRPPPPPAASTGARAAKAPAPKQDGVEPAPEPEPRDAAEFGMIGLLSTGADPDAPTAPWGRDDSADPLGASGGLIGAGVGDSFGAGGLGLIRAGEGAGVRRDELGIGLGSLGHGAAGTATGQGFGSSSGRLGAARTSAPQLKMGAASVTGRLPPEVIQRIVRQRQNFGRFRLCYENGLRNDPTLRGRIAVKFVIAKDGSVSTVSNNGSDLPDPAVVSCVVRAFTNLAFPSPEGGVVVVVYPIRFDPGDTAPPAPKPAAPATAPAKPAPAPASKGP